MYTGPCFLSWEWRQVPTKHLLLIMSPQRGEYKQKHTHIESVYNRPCSNISTLIVMGGVTRGCLELLTWAKDTLFVWVIINTAFNKSHWQQA